MLHTRTAFFAAFAIASLAANSAEITVETPPNPVDATVRIGNDERWFCTGTLIKPDLVLTAGHCVGGLPIGPETLDVVVGFSDKSKIAGFVAFASHPEGGFFDLALIRLHHAPPAGLHTNLRCGEPPLAVGDEVRSEGFPGGLEGSIIVAWGRISATPYRIAVAPWEAPVYIAQMPIGKGDSGGPVFDAAGRVFAIMVGHNTAQPGWAVLAPVEPICKILEMNA